MGYYEWEPADDRAQIYWENLAQEAEDAALARLHSGDEKLAETALALVECLKETCCDAAEFHGLVKTFFKVDLEIDEVRVLFEGKEEWSVQEYDSIACRECD